MKKTHISASLLISARLKIPLKKKNCLISAAGATIILPPSGTRSSVRRRYFPRVSISLRDNVTCNPHQPSPLPSSPQQLETQSPTEPQACPGHCRFLSTHRDENIPRRPQRLNEAGRKSGDSEARVDGETPTRGGGGERGYLNSYFLCKFTLNGKIMGVAALAC